MRDNSSGQKDITPENFAQPDPRMLYFIQQQAEWVRSCNQLGVVAEVPDNVARLIEVARGAVSYGWYYYPLLTIGVEQCYRCLETAVRERCKQEGIPIETINTRGRARPVAFATLLVGLKKRQLLSHQDLECWNAGRDLRNVVSHPEDQIILMPGQVVGQLATTIDMINRLFQPPT